MQLVAVDVWLDTPPHDSLLLLMGTELVKRRNEEDILPKTQGLGGGALNQLHPTSGK